MNIGMICSNDAYCGRHNLPFPSLIRGLESLGHTVTVSIVAKGCRTDFDAIFGWQTKGENWAEILARVECPFFKMERGWLDRQHYTQIDHEGFNHTASWATRVSHPAPTGSQRRYSEICERLPLRRPVDRRDAGYCLVLGQTGRDSQLARSEIHHPAALCDSVAANLPAGLIAAFRPHPLSKYRPSSMQTLDCSLDEALEGARFVVTINSNAGNDALWAGVPVLCLGPALYEIAGVARRTSIAQLMPDLEFMMMGWLPYEHTVLRYFHWLCARQWTADELASGEPLEQILEQGMNK